MKDLRILLLAMSLFATPVTQGDVISLPKNQTDTEKAFALTLPQRGMSMEMVQTQYGAPLQQASAIGDPPIIRWDYEKFAVYFESQYVIHSVMKK